MSKSAHFSTKARVVDLLGREQIADAPTAITELLKNAIDAAASNAEVRYNTKTRCLEIEDDGLGMRPEDLLNKWMVLATDSKHGQEVGRYDKEWAKYATKEQIEKLKHKPLGEKGIGRLAVAALGNGTLVWTRWGKGNEAKYSLLLVHWHFFRHPGLLLDEIEFPYTMLSQDEDPKVAALQLCTDFADWFEKNQKEWDTINQKTLAAEIKDDLTKVFPNAINEIKFKKDMGTLFCAIGTTSEVNEIYLGDIRKGDDIIASEGLRTFYAFSDPFGQLKTKLNVQAYIDGNVAHGDKSFWQKDDFESCDHTIDINVCKNGFVTGMIRRHKELIKYEFNPPTVTNSKLLPGAFQIKIGYVPGEHKDSILSKEEHTSFLDRLKSFGGLYIYRDGVRVMPYGRADADFLRFEERRSMNAGKYYFSYRRMFGAIYLTSKENPKLEDKAGREGFIQNVYYRNFRNLIIETFIEIANTNFGGNSDYKKDEKKKKEKTREHNKRVKEATNDFNTKFKSTRELLKQNEREFRNKINYLESKINIFEKQSGFNLIDIDNISRELRNLINEFNLSLDNLISELPNMVVLNNSQNAVWDDYLNKRESFELKTQKKLGSFTQRLEVLFAPLKKEKERVDEIEELIVENNKFLKNKINSKEQEFLSLNKKLISEYIPNWKDDHNKKLLKIFFSRLNQNSSYDIVKDKTGTLINLLEESMALQRKMLREEILPFWDTVIEQIKNLESSASSEFAIGEMHREIEATREIDADLSSLAQMGLIIETVSHDYHVLFNDANDTFLKIRKKESEMPKETAQQIKHLQELFNSIDTRLKLLEPLQKQKLSVIKDITGGELKELIEKRFDSKKLQGIQIKFTKRFEKIKIERTNRPALMAALINLIINSIYWVGKTNDPPAIQLDYFPNGFSISDTGPGVNPRDKDRIFSPFFSRRPDGRGLGLYIAKVTLKSSGFDLILADKTLDGGLSGANFIVAKTDHGETNEIDEI
jgi:signal transduction histidine kinase